MEQKEKKRRLKCCRKKTGKYLAVDGGHSHKKTGKYLAVDGGHSHKKTGKYLAVDGGHSHKKRSQIATLLQHVFLLTLQTN